MTNSVVTSLQKRHLYFIFNLFSIVSIGSMKLFSPPSNNRLLIRPTAESPPRVTPGLPWSLKPQHESDGKTKQYFEADDQFVRK